MFIEKLNRHKSSYIDQIPAELIKAGGGEIRSENHNPISSIWNEEEFPEESKESIIYLSIRRIVEEFVVIIEASLLCQLRKKFYSTS
jgi:hypothetical protein